MAEFDLNKVKGNDRYIAGGAALIFVLSFFPWYTVSYTGAIVIARLMGALDNVQLPAGINLITLVVSGLATAILLLRLVNAYHSAGSGAVKVSAHPGFGWYLAILVSGAMTFFAYLNFQTSGEQLPNRPTS